jgi:hypothetical protein
MLPFRSDATSWRHSLFSSSVVRVRIVRLSAKPSEEPGSRLYPAFNLPVGPYGPREFSRLMFAARIGCDHQNGFVTRCQFCSFHKSSNMGHRGIVAPGEKLKRHGHQLLGPPRAALAPPRPSGCFDPSDAAALIRRTRARAAMLEPRRPFPIALARLTIALTRPSNQSYQFDARQVKPNPIIEHNPAPRRGHDD